LCAFDDKRFLLENGIDTLAYGHYKITNETIDEVDDGSYPDDFQSLQEERDKKRERKQELLREKENRGSSAVPIQPSVWDDNDDYNWVSCSVSATAQQLDRQRRGLSTSISDPASTGDDGGMQVDNI